MQIYHLRFSRYFVLTAQATFMKVGPMITKILAQQIETKSILIHWEFCIYAASLPGYFICPYESMLLPKLQCCYRRKILCSSFFAKQAVQTDLGYLYESKRHSYTTFFSWVGNSVLFGLNYSHRNCKIFAFDAFFFLKTGIVRINRLNQFCMYDKYSTIFVT